MYMEDCHIHIYYMPYNYIYWLDILPSMVTHTQNSCSAFNPSAHTQQWTHLEQWAAILCCGAVGGSVPCSRTPQSWYWRWKRALYIHSPPPTIYASRDSNSQPFDYESVSLTIRPRLPPLQMINIHVRRSNIFFFGRHTERNNPELTSDAMCGLIQWKISFWWVRLLVLVVIVMQIVHILLGRLYQTIMTMYEIKWNILKYV